MAKIRDTSIVVMDHPTVEVISKALGPIDGLIGYPFFAAFVTTIDYQKKQFTFTPNGAKPVSSQEVIEWLIETFSEDQAPEKILAPAALWGFVVGKEPGDDKAGVTVQEVRAASPAATAGLQKGDRLLTIDARWTDTVADVFQAAGFVKPLASVKLLVRRGEKDIILSVTPRKGL